jgi:uncharacterized protein (DUF58 family)
VNPLREALLRGARRPRQRGPGSPLNARGDGLEFVELRAYASGDDVRRIDWAASARSGMLQTRVLHEDLGLALAAVLDDSESMHVGRSTTLAESALCALRRWYGAADSADRCLRVTPQGSSAPRLRGRRAAQACLSLTSAEPFFLVPALQTTLALLPQGAALLVISDWFEEPNDDLLAALARRADCTALIARDPWFDGLPLAGFVRIRDAQSAAVRRIFVGSKERARFAYAVRRREALLLERFRTLGWRAAPFSEDDGEAALLRAFGLA